MRRMLFSNTIPHLVMCKIKTPFKSIDQSINQTNKQGASVSMLQSCNNIESLASKELNKLLASQSSSPPPSSSSSSSSSSPLTSLVVKPNTHEFSL
jgi:hypothetical protein